MKKGKAYANRKNKLNKTKGDFYSTPKSLIWVAKKVIDTHFNKDNKILEPCSGLNAISQELEIYGFDVVNNDLYHGGVDYLLHTKLHNIDQVITNPPFNLWDSFVNTAKSHCKKFMYIGRLNYLSTNSRYQSNIWKNLRAIHVFNRYVDYQTPYRRDGHFHVGAMATGWFLWDLQYKGNPTIHILDVQKYATLGNYIKQSQTPNKKFAKSK